MNKKTYIFLIFQVIFIIALYSIQNNKIESFNDIEEDYTKDYNVLNIFWCKDSEEKQFKDMFNKKII